MQNTFVECFYSSRERERERERDREGCVYVSVCVSRSHILLLFGPKVKHSALCSTRTSRRSDSLHMRTCIFPVWVQFHLYHTCQEYGHRSAMTRRTMHVHRSAYCVWSACVYHSECASEQERERDPHTQMYIYAYIQRD